MNSHPRASTSRAGVVQLSPLIPAEGPLLGLNLTESAPVHVGFVRADAPTHPDYDMHYGVEIGVVMSGRVRRYWRSCQTDLQPGQVWYCGIWEPHGWEVLTAPCEHLVLVLLPSLLVDTGFPSDGGRDWLAPFRVSPEDRPQVRGQLRQRVLWLARQLALRAAAPEPEHRLWVRLLTYELLLTLQRGWFPPVVPPAPPSGSLDSLGEAVDLILRTHHMITVPEAASAAGMSSSAFNRAFKKLTGVSFARFALRHRLGQAALQLLRTRDPIKTVAHEWGFTDDSHLHRCFLRHYGCSPGQYRKRRGLQLLAPGPRTRNQRATVRLG
jgi:AraC-like DNA-binding protein